MPYTINQIQVLDMSNYSYAIYVSLCKNLNKKKRYGSGSGLKIKASVSHITNLNVSPET